MGKDLQPGLAALQNFHEHYRQQLSTLRILIMQYKVQHNKLKVELRKQLVLQKKRYVTASQKRGLNHQPQVKRVVADGARKKKVA